MDNILSLAEQQEYVALQVCNKFKDLTDTELLTLKSYELRLDRFIKLQALEIAGPSHTARIENDIRLLTEEIEFINKELKLLTS